ncbi:transglutaminase [Halostagnicola larsenii XH-48]|uniref:Transglutaminase n=1 Tax=Halostagnicola larsenii XH-48 TaxID=797299 RepID=W0JTB8_9EURY|nr:transglutaminaseTgpA domain-containing protein [Halostagnicola larsenii]AHG00485.1 transglutaminase [Halostagnicola larsenii XH-48]
MSSQSKRRVASVDLDGAVGPKTFRILALGGIGMLTASYLRVLHQDITSVVGGSGTLLAIIAASMVAATALAYTIRPRTAVIATLVAAVCGFAYYLSAAGINLGIAIGAWDSLLSDALTLATGLSILRMVEAGTWAFGFAPGPVFLSWYLAMRKRYVLSVVPGGFALLFLVLTGNAGIAVTLFGTLGGITAVAFGELARRDGSIAQADVLAIAFALMIALSLSVTVVPGGQNSGPIFRDSGGPTTLEGTIDASPSQSEIGGPVDLSPEVRFTATAEEPAYWRTGVYDRFTGDGWVRTGEMSTYDGRLESPPGEYETVEQEIDLETAIQTMPTAAQPLTVESSSISVAEVSDHGQLHPAETLLAQDSYTVESAVVDPGPNELRAAGTNYPSEIRDSEYRQLPEGTSDEFEAETAAIVEDADSPYEKASAIESHLRSSKGYSLDVEKPSGNVAENFLLEMDEGYCVYFATAMTQMLRAEDVPARYVAGYATGQQVDDNEWVVRGLDSHAWVEVYFPGHGWVEFDPTPPSDRQGANNDALQDAREQGQSGIDTDQSEDVPIEDEQAGEDTDPNTENESEDPNENESEANESNEGNESNGNQSAPGPENVDGVDTTTGPEDEGGILSSLSFENVVIGLSALVALVAGAHRSGVGSHVSRTAHLYWHGSRETPTDDAVRAYRRLEILLERAYRPRRDSESTREYLAALASTNELDPRVQRVGQAYELATYSGEISRERADEAIELVDELARERVPVIGDSDKTGADH